MPSAGRHRHPGTQTLKHSNTFLPTIKLSVLLPAFYAKAVPGGHSAHVENSVIL
jgi:hypothetical protein